jgi:hypothetical protein
MVPLYAARVSDLRVGRFVAITCRHCGHLAELPVVRLREKLAPSAFIKHLGPQFRCRECYRKGLRWMLGVRWGTMGERRAANLGGGEWIGSRSREAQRYGARF